MEKIAGGYYIKARQIKNSWIAHASPVVREIWDYLLREANHKTVGKNGSTIERGQLFRSFSEIREALHWKVGFSTKRYSTNQMKYAMKLLRENQMIELTIQPKGSLITILNYDKYQDPSSYDSTTCTHQPMNQPTIQPMNQPEGVSASTENDGRIEDKIVTNQPTNQPMNQPMNQPPLINKNVKNNTYVQKFDLFWKSYPKKRDKEKAEKRFRKINPDEKLFSEIMAGLNRQKDTEGWTKNKGEFIPLPSTWLNNKRWRDEIEVEIKASVESSWAHLGG